MDAPEAEVTIIELAEEGFLARLCELRIYDDRIEALPARTRWSRRGSLTIPEAAVSNASFRRGKLLESYLTLSLANGKRLKWKWTRRNGAQGKPANADEVQAALSRVLGSKLSVS